MILLCSVELVNLYSYSTSSIVDYRLAINYIVAIVERSTVQSEECTLSWVDYIEVKNYSRALNSLEVITLSVLIPNELRVLSQIPLQRRHLACIDSSLCVSNLTKNLVYSPNSLWVTLPVGLLLRSSINSNTIYIVVITVPLIVRWVHLDEVVSQSTLVEGSSTCVRQELLSLTHPIHLELSASLIILLNSTLVQSVNSICVRWSYIYDDTVELSTNNLNIQSNSLCVSILLLNESNLGRVSEPAVANSDLSTTSNSSSVSLISQSQLTISIRCSNPSSLRLNQHLSTLNRVLDSAVDNNLTCSRRYSLVQVSLSNYERWIRQEWNIPNMNSSSHCSVYNRCTRLVSLASSSDRDTNSINCYILLCAPTRSILWHLGGSTLEYIPTISLAGKHTVHSQHISIVLHQLSWSLALNTNLAQILRACQQIEHLVVNRSTNVLCLLWSYIQELNSERWSLRILLQGYEYILSTIVSKLDDSLTSRSTWSVSVCIISDGYSSLTNLTNMYPSSLGSYSESVGQSWILDSIAQRELASSWSKICLRSTRYGDLRSESLTTVVTIVWCTRHDCKRSAYNRPHKCKNLLHNCKNLKLKIKV